MLTLGLLMFPQRYSWIVASTVKRRRVFSHLTYGSGVPWINHRTRIHHEKVTRVAGVNRGTDGSGDGGHLRARRRIGGEGWSAAGPGGELAAEGGDVLGG